jgi:hypothetical protein
MARADGLDNAHPRKHVGALDGLPLRLRSAHYALLENFAGGFAAHSNRIPSHPSPSYLHLDAYAVEHEGGYAD